MTDSTYGAIPSDVTLSGSQSIRRNATNDGFEAFIPASGSPESDPVFLASEAADFVAGDKTKLDGIATGAEVNVNADWDASSGDAQILNKPATMPPSAEHVAETSDKHPFISNLLSTGIIKGGILSVNVGNGQRFDVSAGIGIVVDNYTDPASPVRKIVTWDAMEAVVDDYRTTHEETGIAIQRTASGDGVGTLVQQNTSTYTDEQRRDLIILGWTSHIAMAGDLDDAFSEGYYLPDTMSQMQDFIENFGAFNIEGNDYEVASGLTIQKGVGKVYDNGTNYSTTPKSPNIIVSDTENPIADIYYYYRDTDGEWVNTEAPVGSIDPDNYDGGIGVGKTGVPDNKWTIQTIFFYAPWGTTDVQYGQAIYQSKEEAESVINHHIEVNPWVAWDVFRMWLIVKKGTTDLSSETQAKFISGGKLGLVSVASGSGAGGEVNTVSNEGTEGVGIYIQKTDVNFELKNIAPASSKITVTNNPTNKTIDIDLGTVTQDDIGDGVTYKQYSDTEKTKLAGIAAGAEVNVNADWSSGSGDSQIMNKPTIPAAPPVTDAANDVQVGDGLGAWIKKTLAEFKTILGLGSAAYTASTDYQVVLVSGTNIKTINGETVLGSGNLTVSGSTPEVVLTKRTITANYVITTGYSAYVSGGFEIPSGFSLEIASNAAFEIG